MMIDYYDKYPVKCHICGSDDLTDIVKDQIGYIPVEIEIYCENCGTLIGYYAYGHFMPEVE